MSSPTGARLGPSDVESEGGALVVPGSRSRQAGAWWSGRVPRAEQAPLAFLSWVDTGSDPRVPACSVSPAAGLDWTPPSRPSRGRACSHPRPQGTKADLRAGSAPVTDEPSASHCSLSPALSGGCSCEADQVKLGGRWVPAALPVVPGTVLVKIFSAQAVCG